MVSTVRRVTKLTGPLENLRPAPNMEDISSSRHAP
jgi:hypothetical protein